MKLFSYGKDGGPESTVWGFWFIEIKCLFSIVILCFENGTRSAYHNHAFNSISWLLKGRLIEYLLFDKVIKYTPSIFPILTYKNTFHKVNSDGRSWVISFRGPWSKTWNEYLPELDKKITLTNHRKLVN